jgi:hypothetical protein
VLVGQAEAEGLDAEAEAVWVAVEGFLFRGGFEAGQLLGAEDRLVDLAGLEALGDDLDGLAERHDDEDLDRLGEDRPAEDGVRLQLVALHVFPRDGPRPPIDPSPKVIAAKDVPVWDVW